MLKTVSSIVNAIGALNYKGTWNANTNSPALASGVGIKGDYYVVSVAGSTSLDGISNWGVGDWATFNGSVWQRVEGGADLNGVNLTVTNDGYLNGVRVGRGGITPNSSDTCVGAGALAAKTGGFGATAVGNNALASLTTGQQIVAVGAGALQSGQTSRESVAVGHNCLNATTGSYETAIGRSAGAVSTGGGVAFAGGYSAFGGLTTGGGIAIGVNAATNATTATNVLIIGTNSDVSNIGSTGEIVVGHGLTAKGNNTTYIGGTAGAYNAKNVTTWETVSDERIKRNIVDANKGLAELMQLRVRNFQYKEEADMPQDESGNLLAGGLDPTKQITGFVAQEIRQVLPECVTENSNGLLSVSVDPVIYVMINSIQQLKAELDAAKLEIQSLKGI